MRRVTLSLVVLAVVGLVASTAWAGTSSPAVSLHVGTAVVGHSGSYGHGPSHHGSYYRSPGHRYPSYYRGGAVIVRPLPPPPPAVIYPGYPTIYRYPAYYYGPSGVIHYQGRGFGISLGF